MAQKPPRDPVPEDLLAHPLIHDQQDDGWPVGLDRTSFPVRPQERYLPGYDLTLLAAAEGLGIVLAREPYGGEFCMSAGLVPVQAASQKTPGGFISSRTTGAHQLPHSCLHSE